MSKNINLKHSLMAVFLTVMMTGSLTLVAKPQGPITHANAHLWIQKHLACDTAIAQLVKALIQKADNIIYDFLDYNGNKETWDTHIAKFAAVMEDIKKLEQDAHKKHAKAAKALHKFHIDLGKILQYIQDARAGKMFGGTLQLGLKLQPIFEGFDNELPVSMTIASKIKAHYNGRLDYLTHLGERLNMA